MSLGLCAPLLAGQGLEPTLGPAPPPVPSEKTRRGSPAALWLLPTLGPPSLWFGREAERCWLLVLGMSELGAPEASLSFHKGDMGLEEKGPARVKQPAEGPVIVGPLVTVLSSPLGHFRRVLLSFIFWLTHSWHEPLGLQRGDLLIRFTYACLWLYCWES